MNKPIRIFLSFPLNCVNPSLFIVSIFLSFVYQLHGETYLSADLVVGESGEVIQVPILFDTNDSIVGADIVLKFDSEGVELGEILPGNSISNHEIYDDQSTPGELKITILSMTNDYLTEGNLSILSFFLLKDYNQSTDVVSVDLSQSILVSKSASPFSILPFPAELPIETAPDSEQPPVETNEDNQSSQSSNNPDSTLITIEAEKQEENEKPIAKDYQNNNWALDSVDFGNGWRAFDWFGNFFQVDDSNWMYHEYLGWLYRSGDTIASTWLWSEIWGWVWTSYEAYPYLALSSGDWLFYLKDSSNPIRYYDYGLEKWSQFDPAHRFTVILESDRSNGGITFGPSHFYLGENVSLVAKPKSGFVFSGWNGDVKSGVNPLVIEKPNSNISVTAKFVSISELINDGLSAINLSHLNAEEKQKAISQLLLLGYSEYVDSGDASHFDLFSDNSSTFGSKVFNSSFTNESSSIKHSHFDINNQSDRIEFLVNNSKRVGSVYFSGTEEIRSVNCAILEINASKDHFEKRWLAQDEKGNVWLIQSEVNDQTVQTIPTVILPQEISLNWKSWPSGFSVPSDFSVLTDFPFRIRPFTFKVVQNCLAISLNRTHFEEQKEVYSPGKGLVKISK